MLLLFNSKSVALPQQIHQCRSHPLRGHPSPTTAVPSTSSSCGSRIPTRLPQPANAFFDWRCIHLHHRLRRRRSRASRAGGSRTGQLEDAGQLERAPGHPQDHGYDRVEQKEDDWSIFWCAGQIEPSDLCWFQPHQKVNKFPRASALTLKSNLWSCFARMLHKHGPQHYGYMPQTFVLPAQVNNYEEFMNSRLAEPQGQGDVWILKPAAAYCGRGIFLHRPSDVKDEPPLWGYDT